MSGIITFATGDALGNNTPVSPTNPLPTTAVSGGAAVTTANPQPTTNVGSTSVSRILSAAATTNPTSAKTSAGVVHAVSGFNANAAPRYLKFYNKASAPTVGTDTPIWTEYLAPQSKFSIALSLYFATGIAYALTTGVADADTGALTAADVLALNVAYR